MSDKTDIHPQFKTLAVFGKHPTTNATAKWVEVADFLRSQGCEVLVAESSANSLSGHDYKPSALEDIMARATAAVVVGGDGTLLGVGRALADSHIPLIGVNQGRLGFMTDITLDELDSSLGEMIRGNFTVEERAYFQTDLVRDNVVIHSAKAINDVVITRGIVGGMVDLRVSVNHQFMYDLRSDALILSTPTGSTAYALSAHGPILHPQLAGIVIVPVAPHALTNRPIALPQSSIVDIEVQGGKETAVHFDMQSNTRAEVGDIVRVRTAASPVKLIHPLHYDYFSMLRQKLHWSTSPSDWPLKPRGSRDSGHAA